MTTGRPGPAIAASLPGKYGGKAVKTHTHRLERRISKRDVQTDS